MQYPITSFGRLILVVAALFLLAIGALVSADAPNDDVGFRRISDGIWGGHGHMVPAPVLAGSVSVWVGAFEDEATAMGWLGGLGYGNNWHKAFCSPRFVDPAGNQVHLSYDYFIETEIPYDSVTVYLRGSDGSHTKLAQYNGIDGTPVAPLLESINFTPTAGDTFNIVWRFVSDGIVSDQDGFAGFNTINGPFAIDDINLTGASLMAVDVAPPYGFEGGWDGFNRGCAGGAVSAEPVAAPLVTALHQNVPNPFNPTTTIRFELSEPGRVDLRVYDVTGRLVRILVSEDLPAERHSVPWNGEDNRGRRVASGVYFYRIATADFVATRKMVLLK